MILMNKSGGAGAIAFAVNVAANGANGIGGIVILEVYG